MAGTWAKTADQGQPPYGTPEIRGDIDNQLQAKGNLQTADKMSFAISCRIVDKRPNGNCVLEGTWSVRDNEENWEYSLSGEIRPEDIKPDNSVVSDTIADLKIITQGSGPRPRQLPPRLGLGMARQVAAVLGVGWEMAGADRVQHQSASRHSNSCGPTLLHKSTCDDNS